MFFSFIFYNYTNSFYTKAFKALYKTLKLYYITNLIINTTRVCLAKLFLF